MPATKERTTQGNGRRSVFVTGRAIAFPSAQVAFGFYQSDHARSLSLGSRQSGTTDQGDAGVSQVARPRPVPRLRPPEPAEHHGYPLRRTQLVTFNREKVGVTAELKEASRLLGLQGLGIDEDAALRDLERRFDQLVWEKVRIPPHARGAADDTLRVVINHLVDWDQFARENPPSRLLWGKIERLTSSRLPMIHWLVGPDGLRERSAVLPRKFWTPYFGLLAPGDWFRGAAREYFDHVEWDDPPTRCPDPTDPRNRQAVWDAIPCIGADDPDAWPLKRK